MKLAAIWLVCTLQITRFWTLLAVKSYCKQDFTLGNELPYLNFRAKKTTLQLLPNQSIKYSIIYIIIYIIYSG